MTVDGCRTAVDAKPLSLHEHAQAVFHGRHVYTPTGSGRLMRMVVPSRPVKPGTPLFGSHPCGKTGLNPALYEEPAQEEPRSPCARLDGCPRVAVGFLLLDGDENQNERLPWSCQGCEQVPF